MPDPHGVGEEISRHTVGGATLRFGIVTARTDYGTHNTATVTINGIPMPYLVDSSPQVGDYGAYLDDPDERLYIGEYGTDIPRIKTYLSTVISVAPNSVATPGDILFDGNGTTEYQHRLGHSHGFLPHLHSIEKTGAYRLSTALQFAAGDGNVRVLILRVNGATVASDWSFAPSIFFPTRLSINGPYELAAGDTLSIAYVHNASGNINIDPGRLITFFSADRFAASI